MSGIRLSASPRVFTADNALTIIPSKPPKDSLRTSMAFTKRFLTASPNSIDLRRANAASPSENEFANLEPISSSTCLCPFPNIATARACILEAPSMKSPADLVDINRPVASCQTVVFSAMATNIASKPRSDLAAFDNESKALANFFVSSA